MVSDHQLLVFPIAAPISTSHQVASVLLVSQEQSQILQEEVVSPTHGLPQHQLMLTSKFVELVKSSHLGDLARLVKGQHIQMYKEGLVSNHTLQLFQIVLQTKFSVLKTIASHVLDYHTQM